MVKLALQYAWGSWFESPGHDILSKCFEQAYPSICPHIPGISRVIFYAQYILMYTGIYQGYTAIYQYRPAIYWYLRISVIIPCLETVTRQCCKAGKAWLKVKEVFDSTSTSPEYIPEYTEYIPQHPCPIPAYTHFLLVTVWTAIYQIPTPVYHAMYMGCASIQIQSSETSPKVWKNLFEI